VTNGPGWPKVVGRMHQLLDLFHKIYDVQGLVRIGGLALIAGVVFAETGLLVGFFLPGDSLLVTAGLYCTSANPDQAPLLNIVTLNLAVMAAAIIGDTVGYWIGAKAGPAIFTREKSLLFSKKHLLRTKDFYERHGGKTIIIARFLPFLRTFAPVVAGVGKMSYRRFVSFNIFGGIGWVPSMTMLGFTLGKIYPPITKQIDKVIIVIIFVSLLPGAISWLINRKKSSPTTPTLAL
jgi:membrane-associated protein